MPKGNSYADRWLVWEFGPMIGRTGQGMTRLHSVLNAVILTQCITGYGSATMLKLRRREKSGQLGQSLTWRAQNLVNFFGNVRRIAFPHGQDSEAEAPPFERVQAYRCRIGS